MKKVITFLYAIIACMSISAQTVSDSVAHANGLWKENGVVYIDLGLPSGTCWAVKNIGSSSSKDSGCYLHLGNDDKGALDPATVFLGSNWKIPTSKQWEELISNSEFYWNIIDINPGLTLRSKINGHFLYLGAYGAQIGEESFPGKDVQAAYPCRDMNGDTKIKCYIGTKEGICSAVIDQTYSLPIRAVYVKKNK